MSPESQSPDQHGKRYFCQRCLNHGLEFPRKGHKPTCAYAVCACELCSMVEQRRQINYQLSQKRPGDDEGLSFDGRKIRAPKCARCSAHGKKQALRGHKRALCPFNTCSCDMCALVENRRTLMARQIRVRRTQQKQRQQQHSSETPDVKPFPADQPSTSAPAPPPTELPLPAPPPPQPTTTTTTMMMHHPDPQGLLPLLTSQAMSTLAAQAHGCLVQSKSSAFQPRLLQPSVVLQQQQPAAPPSFAPDALTWPHLLLFARLLGAPPSQLQPSAFLSLPPPTPQQQLYSPPMVLPPAFDLFGGRF